MSALGVAVSLLGLAGLVTGQLRMSVTSIGLFVFGVSVWTVGVGAGLCRASGPR